MEIDDVRCHGLRNGSIAVTAVFGGEPPYYYSIDGDNFSTNTLFDRLRAGDYKIYVRDASGCIKELVATVSEPERLEVFLNSPDTIVEAGIPVLIRTQILPKNAVIQHIEWRPPLSFPDQNSFRQTTSFSENTTVAVRIIDERGCIADAQINIIVEKTRVFFPNIINPLSNNDDFFTAFADEGVAEVELLQIYTRTGSLVFEKKQFPPNEPLLGWNGKNANGKRSQTGVYLYVAKVRYHDGNRKDFSGTVTVLY